MPTLARLPLEVANVPRMFDEPSHAAGRDGVTSILSRQHFTDWQTVSEMVLGPEQAAPGSRNRPKCKPPLQRADCPARKPIRDKNQGALLPRLEENPADGPLRPEKAPVRVSSHLTSSRPSRRNTASAGTKAALLVALLREAGLRLPGPHQRGLQARPGRCRSIFQPRHRGRGIFSRQLSPDGIPRTKTRASCCRPLIAIKVTLQFAGPRASGSFDQPGGPAGGTT